MRGIPRTRTEPLSSKLIGLLSFKISLMAAGPEVMMKALRVVDVGDEVVEQPGKLAQIGAPVDIADLGAGLRYTRFSRNKITRHRIRRRTVTGIDHQG